MSVRLLAINRAAGHLAIEHDGARFDWYGPAAMAVIDLVEHMMKQQPPDYIDTIGRAVAVAVNGRPIVNGRATIGGDYTGRHIYTKPTPSPGERGG